MPCQPSRNSTLPEGQAAIIGSVPFTAFLNGRKINALDFSPDEWESLKREKTRVTFDCCVESGHLVTSRKATQFFRHQKNSTCQWAKESPEHLECKRIIYQTAKEHGYLSEMEAVGDGWRADVLVKAGERRFAFEIQLSEQSLKETLTRSLNFLKGGVVPIWLMGKKNVSQLTQETPGFKRGIPGFEVRPKGKPIVIPDQSRSEKIPLEDFTLMVLDGRLQVNRPSASEIQGALQPTETESPVERPWYHNLLMSVAGAALGYAVIRCFHSLSTQNKGRRHTGGKRRYRKSPRIVRRRRLW